MKREIAFVTLGACLLVASTGMVSAADKPHAATTGVPAAATGQPGASNGVTCGNGTATMTPGGSASAGGSPFNPSGQAGNVYAGNPGTASVQHSPSTAAVSQYDIACQNFTTQPP